MVILYYITDEKQEWFHSPSDYQMFSNLGNKLLPRWSFRMLNDKTRNTAYYSALQECITEYQAKTLITPSVLDLGSGVGLLSLYADVLGASTVFGVEQDDLMHDVAREVCKNNSKIVLHHNHSSNVAHGIECDVVVSETLDCIGIGEGVITSFSDITAKHFAGTLIPSKITIKGFLIYSEILQKHSFGPENTRSKVGTSTDTYCCEFIDEFSDVQVTSSIRNLLQYDLYESHKYGKSQITIVTFRISRATWCNGLVSYFIANLFKDISISSVPALVDASGNHCSCWEQGYFPLPKRWLEENQQVDVKVESSLTGFTVSWIRSDFNEIDYHLVNPSDIKYINSNFASCGKPELLNTIPKYFDTSGVLLGDPMMDDAVLEFSVNGIVINSNSIRNWCEITHDDNLLLSPKINDTIRKLLNKYRTQIHENVPWATVKHTKLSGLTRFVTVKKSNYDSGKVTKCNVTLDNSTYLQPTCVVVWYSLQFRDGSMFDSMKENLWRPAAYMLNSNNPFNSQNIEIICSYSDGSLVFQLN